MKKSEPKLVDRLMTVEKYEKQKEQEKLSKQVRKMDRQYARKQLLNKFKNHKVTKILWAGIKCIPMVLLWVGLSLLSVLAFIISVAFGSAGEGFQEYGEDKKRMIAQNRERSDREMNEAIIRELEDKRRNRR